MKTREINIGRLYLSYYNYFDTMSKEYWYIDILPTLQIKYFKGENFTIKIEWLTFLGVIQYWYER